MKKHSAVPRRFHTAFSRMSALTFSHFMTDLVSCALPGFLPVAMRYFGLDLSLGVVIVSTMSIGCNLMQIPAAKIGETSRSPAWLIAGLLLLGCLTTIGILPRSTPFPAICLLMLLVGFGIALAHPTGLRGVQNITEFPSGLTTPTFMTGGFLGGALGPWLASLLVGAFGLKGLFLLIPPLVLVVLAVHLSNVKLATEPASVRKAASSSGKSPAAAGVSAEVPWSFAALFLIAFFMNSASTAFSGLLTYMLNVELNFPLWFGGASTMLFGTGSAVVSILLGIYSAKHRTERIIPWIQFCGVPATAAYFLLAGHAWGCVFAFLGGALASSSFPILVSMAKTASGKLPLGARMGLIVGGTWGLGGVVFLGVGSLASHYGTRLVTGIAVPGFYFLAFLTALLLRKRRKNKPSCL